MIDLATTSREAHIDVDGRTIVITIDRPSARNAMTLDVAQAIAAALDLLDSSDDLTTGVLTGAGGTFCAGMDLKELAAGRRATVPGRGFGGLVEAPPRKPLIAAVEGCAFGGGFELMLACDMVVAGEGATFALPEVKRGLIARGGGALRLPTRLPRTIALELLLTGQPISAQRAEHFGLVNEVVPDGGALASALALAGTIGANGPLAVSVTKQIVTDSEAWAPGEMFARQEPLVTPVFSSDDAAEGVSAFREKRAPVWTGR
ncbi:crotonase/enoyl-CoA hydratase family protein [Rhodococcus sp. NPDC127530]|uniref:crotonase/enoyl-CoA hydratase family protein n=1 Tax=unclassified Rhodococcus (in: high G+C Gram-positive bacteria) TaxID=192944 RepID=UPI00363A69E1